MWRQNDVIAWRGIYKNRIWHAHSVIVVKDSPEEVVVALLPGAECLAPSGYVNGKRTIKRRWEYTNPDWELEKFTWRSNRLLYLIEPETYYATMLFWDDHSNEFSCYYINFQLPFHRSRFGMDALDLELDLIVNPDFSFEWKDIDDYQNAIETGTISMEWGIGIEIAVNEIKEKLEKHKYPFDGSWLNWKPDPAWKPTKFLDSWYEI